MLIGPQGLSSTALPGVAVAVLCVAVLAVGQSPGGGAQVVPSRGALPAASTLPAAPAPAELPSAVLPVERRTAHDAASARPASWVQASVPLAARAAAAQGQPAAVAVASSRTGTAGARRPTLTRRPGVPVHLSYPRLGIRAAVEPKPEVRGVLQIPADVRRVGWDSATPRPGSPGTTLLAGHVDSKRAGDGALAPLGRARPGDLLTLALGATHQQRWKVVAVRQVRKTGLPADLLTLNGSPRLVLVTCGGPFNRRTGHYRDNLIVYAVQA